MDKGKNIEWPLPPQNNKEKYGQISMSQLEFEPLILVAEQPHALGCAATGVSFTIS
jgi:hypothetical protein